MARMATDPLAPVRAALLRPLAPSSDFDLNPGTVLPAGRKLRPAGVLVPFRMEGESARLILTVRSSALRHHPGQIAFPGGKQDARDPDVIAAALREAEEEIGLDRRSVEILGLMARHETVTGFDVTPVLARVPPAFRPVPEAGEVAEVFEVPLAHVLDKANYRIEARHWGGTLRWYFTVPYGPYYIWGATARMLRMLAEAAEPG
jgi:8-oxo-dGTP pyrophosphatase MutT (NUDIX family)